MEIGTETKLEIRGLRILVADDHPAIRELLTELLEAEGALVETVASGLEAWTKLKEPFDVLLTDLKMPEVDGLELIRRTVQLDEPPVIVMMTGYGTVDTAVEAMKLGAYDYVLKPFRPNDIMTVMLKAWRRRLDERERAILRSQVDFYELSRELSQAGSLDSQLQSVVELSRRECRADYVTLLTLGEGETQFISKAQSGDVDLTPWVGPEMLSLSTGVALTTFELAEAVPSWRSRGEALLEAFAWAPLRVRGTPIGLLCAGRGPGNSGAFSDGERRGLEIFGSRAAAAIDSHSLYDDLQGTFTQTLEGFARALEAKDSYTHGHSDRVAFYARLICEMLGLPAPEIDQIEHGGLMHDIGKIGIGGSQLNKPQRLTADEYLMFQSHPVKGKRILEPVSFLRHLIPCVYHHHESWDGTGYPEGLDGEAIPLEARIMAVADTYDAMTSDRPYRKALPHYFAMKEIRACAGKQFDPKVVEAFEEAIEAHRRDCAKHGKWCVP
ncbi:MAG: HD domain-containing phosphohydrolase [Myxococcota bacterium]|nr:HD domain-containing phosphohydrolase [Myxococcota bacterium]